jgi:hypothetical protein
MEPPEGWYWKLERVHGDLRGTALGVLRLQTDLAVSPCEYSAVVPREQDLREASFAVLLRKSDSEATRAHFAVLQDRVAEANGVKADA